MHLYNISNMICSFFKYDVQTSSSIKEYQTSDRSDETTIITEIQGSFRHLEKGKYPLVYFAVYGKIIDNAYFMID